MDNRIADIKSAVGRLRHARKDILSKISQAEVVEALAEWGRRWQDPCYPPRRQAETLQAPFPFAMARVSLVALLDSLTPAALWALMDAEGVRNASGYPLVGHVIAGNTPLLSWVSVIRALLMRSASFVKLPSGPAAEWGRVFAESLQDVSPPLADCVHCDQWPGGTIQMDAALCEGVDMVLAYGGDDTMSRLQSLCPPKTAFLGYGHRVSFGLVPAGTASDEAARGFAKDVLLYDQGGCLSPHTIFVEGGQEQAITFAGQLAAAMPEAAVGFPLPPRTPPAAMRVREARLLARMADDCRLWEDEDLRWTVIARRDPCFALSPTHGVVSVQPVWSLKDLPRALAPVTGRLQGCAVAGMSADIRILAGLGVSYTCAPGCLQAPPLAWRQNGRDVLRSFLPCGRITHFS